MREKKKFKMPHLLWIMTGLILLASICTYIIPAGQFGTNEAGQIMGDSFSYLGYQTPVSPWRAIFLFLDGLTGSGLIIFTVMAMGANVAVILETGAVDDFLNWAIYKLKDKGEGILISILFCLMVYLGGFGGSDALIAVVPIGLLFTRKLKLDPIVAIGVTTYATLIGFGTGPTKQVTTQMLMDVPAYSAFGTRFFFMNLFMVIGLIFLLRYVKKVKKDPTKSLMYGAGWDPNQAVAEDEESSLIKETKLTWRTAAIMTIFFGQYFIIVLFGGGGTGLYNFMVAVSLISAVIAGIIGKMSADQLAGAVAKDLANMAFVGFVIGLARVMSLVMTEGNIIHTVVYALTRPLMGLPKSVSSIGMTVIIAIINPFIPSATSKAAILVPIIKPIAETLHLAPQLAVQAFQFGDGFTNLISPALGWTVGSCAMANVPFDKWFRWVLPKVIFFMALSFALMFVLTSIGWGI